MSAVHWLTGCAVCGLACANPAKPQARPVSQAWERPAAEAPRPTASPAGARAGLRTSTDGEPSETIAVIDGRPIAREALVDLLLRAHGVGVLEQLVVHDAAQRVAREKGLTVSTADVARERDIALARLVKADDTGGLSPRQQTEAESLLREVLARQNISEREFQLGIERNAALRRIVTHEMRYSDADLLAEFERSYGERIEIRHIQVRTLTEAQRVAEQLAGGADFAGLARRFSGDRATADDGGLLPPFSQRNQDVPAVLRDAAFKLAAGAVSNPIRIRHEARTPDPLAVEEWFHIIRIERRLPASDQPWQDVRPDLERRLSARLVEPAMQELHRGLFLQADIDVLDPVLREEFERKHGRRNAEGDTPPP